MARIVVCGGSVIGLATAMMLAGDGHTVEVFDADPSAPPDRPADAWEHWHRRGVAQIRQPHNLFARARKVLDEELSGITEALIDAGCVWVDPLASLPPSITDWTPRDDDDRFRFVTGRRPTIEATFASMAATTPNLAVRRGVQVEGLIADANGTVAVTGVRLANGEEVRADLVVDATGRRSKLVDWLAAVGADAPLVESEDSGFVYYTRYFVGPQLPVQFGPPAIDLGTISILTLAGDNDTWSVTVWAASDDAELRTLRDADRFAAVVGACPLQAHWLQGEPITDVLVMAGITDKYRRFVVDGEPVAVGVVAVGDAWACTNPSAGRGISVGLADAQQLRHAVRESVDDSGRFALDGLARRFDDATEREVTPFYRSQIAADRVRFATMEALRRGEEPPAPDPRVAAAFAALPHDGEVFRGLMEVVTCLAPANAVFTRPDFAERVARHAGESPMRFPGPTRAELLALLGG